MDKIDDNNSRTKPSEKLDDYLHNPWTRQAARERNKRKKRNASDGKASEPCPNYRRFAKEQNYAPKVKQQRQRIGVLARTFDIGTAPHRQALDQSVFDASVESLI